MNPANSAEPAPVEPDRTDIARPRYPDETDPPRQSARRRRFSSGRIGMVTLVVLFAACLLTLPWTLASSTWPTSAEPAGDGGEAAVVSRGTPRYNAGLARENRLPPWWAPVSQSDRERLNALVAPEHLESIERRFKVSPEQAIQSSDPAIQSELRREWPTTRHKLFSLWGTDELGRSVFIRCLTGGGISLTIGLLAAATAVTIGTLYGSLAVYLGGRADAIMMRIVDILFGLPYVLLVVLLAVAVDATVERWQERRADHAAAQRAVWMTEQATLASQTNDAPDHPRQARDLEAEALTRFGTGEISGPTLQAINILTLWIAIGGVSWLTMARVVRGQVLSIKAQPFMEAARAIGVPWRRQFTHHLLPNLIGTIIVYATLTVPSAILQESFLSFLGIGVKPPLPSWGTLAAEGLESVNPYKSNWWLLLFPCLLLACTLLALNFVGESLRESFEPRRRRA